MKKTEKSKVIKTALLLLSTLLFPLQFFSVVFYFIPSLYIGLIVPYFIWKIWFDEDNKKIKKISLIWKLPIIFFLAMAMYEVEMMFIFLVLLIESFTLKLIFFICLLLIFRCMTYLMMIFVWQSDISVPYRKLIYALILAYSIAVADFWYSCQNAPDTDDYNKLFYENMVSE